MVKWGILLWIPYGILSSGDIDGQVESWKVYNGIDVSKNSLWFRPILHFISVSF